MTLKTVAILIINTEFLQGENGNDSLESHFLIQELTALNYNIQKLLVVRKNVNLIAHELQLLSKQNDIVLMIERCNTNFAYKALAKAFYVNCKENQKFKNVLNKRAEFEENDMSIPASAKVLVKKEMYPIVYLQRIFILKLEYIKEQYSFLKNHLHNYKLEKFVCVEVNKNGKTSLGNFSKNISYKWLLNGKSSVLKISASDLTSLNSFTSEILKTFHNEALDCYIPPLGEALLYDDDTLIEQAIDAISECFDTYGPENIFIAFNGGKDCTVLLHLVNSVLKTKYAYFKKPITCLYVKSGERFSEEDEFLKHCYQYYKLEVLTVQGNIKTALSEVLHKSPNLKACLMGTRRSDPYFQNLEVFQMSDPDWPQVMRVSPLLDWHHSDIWDYLLFYKVFYCKLYDMGYTSLGNKLDTARNPSLFYFDIEKEEEKYLPAYKLLNEADERLGRKKR